jgi:hypothetical protein
MGRVLRVRGLPLMGKRKKSHPGPAISYGLGYRQEKIPLEHETSPIDIDYRQGLSPP